MVNTSDKNSKNRFLPFKENIPQKILAATFQYVLFQWKKHKIVGSNSKSKTLLSNKELQKYSLKWEVTCPAAECLRPTPTFPWEQLFHPRSGWFIKLKIFHPRSCWFIKEDKFFVLTQNLADLLKRTSFFCFDPRSLFLAYGQQFARLKAFLTDWPLQIPQPALYT